MRFAARSCSSRSLPTSARKIRRPSSTSCDTASLTGQPDSALDLVDRMRSYHVPGLSLAIIDNHRVVYAKGFGVAEFGKTKPVDSTTLFLAGSISKPIFASGLLRLVEERKLSLDADVNTMLKSWKLPGEQVHRARESHAAAPADALRGTHGVGISRLRPDRPVPTVPQLLDGTKPANTAAVRNDTFPARGGSTPAAASRSRSWCRRTSRVSLPVAHGPPRAKPAGMTRSTYENPLPVARRGEAAAGHEQIDTPVPGGFHVYPEMAAAGLWTTASDLARWAIALSRSYRGEPGGVLSNAMARQMVSKQIQQQPPYGNGYWGLGVAVGGDGDTISFSHGGRDEGFVANMTMWPRRDAAS